MDLLSLCLALLAALLGTPYLFGFVGPHLQNFVYQAYGEPLLAQLTYLGSFVLSGIVIYAVARMALFYAISAIVTFGAMRLAGMAAF
jgi:hypothetical protein